MKRLKLIVFLFAITTILFGSCAKEIRKNKTVAGSDQPATANYTPPGGYCGYAEFTLLAGQTYNVGTIQVGNDATNLYVTYACAAGYMITETHLYVGTLAALPVTNSGNAIPGHFPYNYSLSSGVTSYTVTIPLASLSNVNGCNVVAAHCVVKNDPTTNSTGFNQTGWISGTRINDGGNWAMYNTWCNAACVELPPEK